MTIKTSELISKLVLASEESCKCEDENYNRVMRETFAGKALNDTISVADFIEAARTITDFSRFASIRTTCKVLQDLGVVEQDVDVLNNDAFRNELAKSFK